MSCERTENEEKGGQPERQSFSPLENIPIPDISSQAVSTSFKFFISAGLVLGGTLSTIFSKMIGQHVTLYQVTGLEGGEPVTKAVDSEFKHPLLLNLFMFLGEALLLVLLHMKLAIDKEAMENHQRTKATPFLFAIPALLDTIGSFLNFTGLVLISASTFQILKMLCMVFVVLLSIIILKRSYSITQYVSVVLVIGGLLVVSLQSIKSDGSSDGSGHGSKGVIIGVVCMILGQFFHASQGILEEYILQGRTQDPLYMMGWEGTFGIIFTLLLFIPAQTLPCPFNEEQCTNGHIDDIFQAQRQFVSKPILALYGGLFVLAALMYNGFGVTVTKHTSATARGIIEQMRTLTVWLFFLFKPGFGHETFSWIKLLGFTIIIIGVVFFNKILAFDGCRLVFGDPEEQQQQQKGQDEENEPLIENGKGKGKFHTEESYRELVHDRSARGETSTSINSKKGE